MVIVVVFAKFKLGFRTMDDLVRQRLEIGILGMMRFKLYCLNFHRAKSVQKVEIEIRL